MRQNLRQMLVSLRPSSCSPWCCASLYPLAVFVVGQVGVQGQGQRLDREASTGRRSARRCSPRTSSTRSTSAPRPSAAGVGYDGNGYDTFGLGWVERRPDLGQAARRPACRCRRWTTAASPSSTTDGNAVDETNPDGSPVCNTATVPQRVAAYRAANGLADDAPVPVDAVTASFSGLDPEISVANARHPGRRGWPSVRGLPVDQVNALVDQLHRGPAASASSASRGSTSSSSTWPSTRLGAPEEGSSIAVVESSDSVARPERGPPAAAGATGVEAGVDGPLTGSEEPSTASRP